jgi:Redoxin
MPVHQPKGLSMTTGAIVVSLTLTIINLILLAAVIRRLRSYEADRAQQRDPVALAVGASVPAFTATDPHGRPFTDADLLGSRTLMGFFSSTCRPCADEAPLLASRSDAIGAGGVGVRPILTIVDAATPGDLLEVLAAAGPVLTEPRTGPIAAAFGVRATPTYVLVGADGRVQAKGHTIDDCLGSSA